MEGMDHPHPAGPTHDGLDVVGIGEVNGRLVRARGALHLADDGVRAGAAGLQNGVPGYRTGC